MVAIVRYVYDRRSQPQVGAAFPLIKNEYEVILMTEERGNIIQSNNEFMKIQFLHSIQFPIVRTEKKSTK